MEKTDECTIDYKELVKKSKEHIQIYYPQVFDLTNKYSHKVIICGLKSEIHISTINS